MKAQWLRRMLNIYPPYVGAGIRVVSISDDYRNVRVEMPLRWYNRNYVGSHFGGNLCSMVDPFYMFMVMHNLGERYFVWDQAASMQFIKAARSTVSATFEISASALEEVRAATQGGEKHLTVLAVSIVDAAGVVIAQASKTIYVRLKPEFR